MKNNKAIIITIGDELLIGQTIDTNSAWMAKRLNELGIDVVRRIAVGDTKEAIVDALDDAIARAAVVLVTGGLGPTADDITKPLLCEYFGGKLVVNEVALENVKTLFIRRNLPMLERNRKQAEVPDNCTVLQNSRGTAPGMWFEKNDAVVVAMPGVPHEMMGMMEKDVLPALQSRVTTDTILHRNILTAGIGESFLAEKIIAVENALPDYIKLAYLPSNWTVKLRLTAKGKNELQLTQEIEQFQQLLKETVGEYVVGTVDEPLESTLQQDFTAQGLTLAIAESCTGGGIGHTLTQVEGSSKFFTGSVVTYDMSVKERILGITAEDISQYGVVSENIAIQMAQRVRDVLHTDIGFGITGWLDKSEEPDKEPGGTVWMAVAGKDKIASRKFVFPYDRQRNKEVAVQMALLMIWKMIHGKAD
ncbi:MAG TPA: CinA family nicotinamide mononucleotide deamidase-related protein [Flavipsychrobacter sp.]|nr:CinA family nicotinamide mononucleotide deamidase-related protein [Flavipsychrobacter sp.]